MNPVMGNEKISSLHSEYGSSSGTSISLTSFSSRLLSILYPRILRLVRKDDDSLLCSEPDMFDIVALPIPLVNTIHPARFIAQVNVREKTFPGSSLTINYALHFAITLIRSLWDCKSIKMTSGLA